ncbi:ATP-grasp domain-containing protein [Streptomyces sp. SCSIO ZS0520]|uniref:ATP-grasp domain-containing protein n=1 Tax=Streptomyces sp. SCSIO ZS0520 TaxID=2892996 RepID=UPI0021DB7DB4|nr:ATP-grasp domain-containing protein [Streptomyces sp. SCSIO ZS0520]
MSGTSDKPTAVVVDGYSAGNFYPAAFAAAGARVIHVQSTPELIPSMLAPDLTAYAENIVDGDVDSLAARLAPLDPVCVVPGQESAVRLADALSEALGVKSNGTRLSPARRDKYEMIETLRRAGVRCARQFKSADPAALVDWAEREGGYPAVVKPLSSAGSDSVFICRDAAEVRAAAERILDGHNIFGAANTEVLAQSYLEGTEYIVDTVSCRGHRYACGIWEYEKTLLDSGQRIYNRDILLAEDQEPAADLVAYVDEVLKALGVEWGPAHAEVIVTEEGPTLVEIGTRLNGNLNPGFHDVALGRNQAALSALAYADPDAFLAQFSGGVYTKRQHAFVYNAPTVLDGIVSAVDGAAVAEMQGLESVFQAAPRYVPGARINPTTDLMTTSMKIFLTGRHQEQLTADYEKVRGLKDLVYRVDQ